MTTKAHLGCGWTVAIFTLLLPCWISFTVLEKNRNRAERRRQEKKGCFQPRGYLKNVVLSHDGSLKALWKHFLRRPRRKPLWENCTTALDPQLQSPLMRLPLEIREMIWEYCFFVPFRYTITLDPDNHGNKHRDHVPIKLTDAVWHHNLGTNYNGTNYMDSRKKQIILRERLADRWRIRYEETWWRMYIGATVRIWSVPYLLDIDRYLPPRAQKVLRALHIDFAVGSPPMLKKDSGPFRRGDGDYHVHPVWQMVIDKLSDLKQVKHLTLKIKHLPFARESCLLQKDAMLEKLTEVDGPVAKDGQPSWGLEFDWMQFGRITAPPNLPFKLVTRSEIEQ